MPMISFIVLGSRTYLTSRLRSTTNKGSKVCMLIRQSTRSSTSINRTCYPNSSM